VAVAVLVGRYDRTASGQTQLAAVMLKLSFELFRRNDELTTQPGNSTATAGKSAKVAPKAASEIVSPW
jgi:hypothetical protein